MDQAAAVEVEVIPEGQEAARANALVVCRACGTLVPRTMMCLYCGAPILFRKPRDADG